MTKSIPDISDNYRQYNGSSLFGAAILVNKNISHFLVSDPNEPTLVAVKVKCQGTELIFVSFYAKKSNPNPMNPLSLFLSNLTCKNVIIAGDFNCHSTLVGYESDDKLARSLNGIMEQHSIQCHNIPGFHTFETRGRKSTIDYTLTSGKANDLVSEWNVDYDAVLQSDHYGIRFNIGAKTINKTKTKYNFNKTNWNNMNTELKNNINHNKTFASNNEHLAYINKAIKEGISSTTPISKGFKPRNDWWTPELDKLRLKLRNARRYKKNQVPQIRMLYNEAILAAKQAAWENFVGSVRDQNDIYIRAKLMLKCKQQNTIPPLRKDDNSLTKSEGESVSLLMEKMFPDFTPHDTVRETRIRNDNLTNLSLIHI